MAIATEALEPLLSIIKSELVPQLVRAPELERDR